jgi:predicted amidophosphoribosyltransferase
VATAAEVLLPLRPGLIPVPATGQPGVCRICHSACDPEYRQCHPCLMAERGIGAVEILPISMSVERGLLHHHLRGYKDDRSAAVRIRMSRRLAALTAVFLDHHRNCIEPFDSVVLVPSPARTAVASIVELVGALRDAHRPALAVAGVGSKADLRADRFSVTRDVEGERVLVLDDTFTSGATLFSALAALRDAGATTVGPVVLGRHLHPDWGPSRAMLSWLQSRPWDEARCCRCDGERANPDQML